MFKSTRAICQALRMTVNPDYVPKKYIGTAGFESDIPRVPEGGGFSLAEVAAGVWAYNHFRK